MKKLASTLPNMLLALGVITAGAGAVLGAMYQVTKEPIEQQARNAQIAAIKEVAPPFDNNPEEDAVKVTVDGHECTVYPAKQGGKLVGAAVKASTMQGFGGEIEVMAGFKADGTINDYRVLRQAETPGLGTKMEDWFRDPTAARSVIGKNPAICNFTVSKDGGDIDAITAATISSRAFLGVMKSAYNAYAGEADKVGLPLKTADSHSGASKQQADTDDSHNSHHKASKRERKGNSRRNPIADMTIKTAHDYELLENIL